MARRKRNRIYGRNQGGRTRYYADFRDYADVGGKREALVPPMGRSATTDLDVAKQLTAERVRELELRRRNRDLLGIEKETTLGRYAAYHLREKKKAGKVVDGTLVTGPRAASDVTAPTRSQDAAFLEVRDLIVTGRLGPGAPIIEAALADQLGFSRAAIRAGLRRLELEGYVNSVKLKKYSRMVVAPLTAESVTELFTIMGSLEGLAAREAAARDAERRAEIAGEMEGLNEALLRASTAKPVDVVEAQELHVRFHAVPVEEAAGPILFAHIDMIKHQVERYERLYTHVLISGIEESVNEHKYIIVAVRAGEPDAAQAATEANWRRGAQRYEQALSQRDIARDQPPGTAQM